MWPFANKQQQTLKADLRAALQVSVASLELSASKLDDAFKELEEALRKKKHGK